MSESDLLRATLRAIEWLPGVHALRLNAGLTVLGTGKNKRAIKGCEPGTPDIEVMLMGGRVIWLECKTPKGRLSKSQVAWHAMASKLGHRVRVVRSVDEAVAAVREATGPTF